MDAIAEWTAAQHRVVELVRGLSDADAATTVLACPAWTVRDLLSHMIGLDADVLAGDEPDDHNETWTQRQVEARAGRTVTDLVSEWDGLVAPLQDWMRANTTRPLGDVIIHEQDLRSALHVPGGRDTDGLRALRDRMAGRFQQSVEGRPPVAFVSDTWTWISSDGAVDGENKIVDAAALVLTASEFDLTRALMSRRSADQLRGWVTRGDIEPYLDAFATLGPLPDRDLVE